MEMPDVLGRYMLPGTEVCLSPQITGEVKNETASPACVRPTSQLSQSIDTPPLFCQLGMLP